MKCNRCNKQKSKGDFNGKPKHLLKKNSNSGNGNTPCANELDTSIGNNENALLTD